MHYPKIFARHSEAVVVGAVVVGVAIAVAFSVIVDSGVVWSSGCWWSSSCWFFYGCCRIQYVLFKVLRIKNSNSQNSFCFL